MIEQNRNGQKREIAIEFKDVGKRFGSVIANNNVSFTLYKG